MVEESFVEGSHCLVRCLSVDVSSLVLWPSWRWTGLLSSGGITCTTSRSTTGLLKSKCIVHGVHVVDGLLWYPPLPGLRRGTRTSLSIFLLASETPPLVIPSLSESAGDHGIIELHGWICSNKNWQQKYVIHIDIWTLFTPGPWARLWSTTPWRCPSLPGPRSPSPSSNLLDAVPSTIINLGPWITCTSRICLWNVVSFNLWALFRVAEKFFSKTEGEFHCRVEMV